MIHQRFMCLLHHTVDTVCSQGRSVALIGFNSRPVRVRAALDCVVMCRTTVQWAATVCLLNDRRGVMWCHLAAIRYQGLDPD